MRRLGKWKRWLGEADFVRANGAAPLSWVGGGSGGRIGVYVTAPTSTSFDGVTFQAFGGSGRQIVNGGVSDGGAGTVYLERTAIDGPAHGQLIIDNNTFLAATTRLTGASAIPLTDTAVGDVIIRNGGILEIIDSNVLLTVAGNWTVTGSIFNNIELSTGQLSAGGVSGQNMTAGTVAFTATSAKTINTGGWGFYNVNFNGVGGTWSLAYALSANNVNIQAGTLAGNGNTITLTGNWTNNASYNATGGTVNLTGVNQTISGNTTFFGLGKNVSTADTLEFQKGSTQTVTGILNLGGAAGNLLALRSTVNGSQWYIAPSGTRTLQYVDVEDSVNTALPVIFPGGPVTGFAQDSTDNINWFNLNYNPAAYAQSVTTHFIGNVAITLTGTDTTSFGAVGTSIVFLPSAGTLYQTSNGATSNGTAITSVPTAVSYSGNVVIYAPPGNGYGTAFTTFGFVTTEDQVPSPSAQVTLNLTDNAPVANAGIVVSGNQDTSMVITLGGTDPDYDPIVSAKIVGLPGKGTLYQTSDGLTYNSNNAILTVPTVVSNSALKVIFMPLSHDYGNPNPYTTFSFTVNDGALDSSPAYVTVNINQTTRPPAAYPQTAVMNANTSLTLTLTGSDPQAYSLTATIVTVPLKGTLYQTSDTNHTSPLIPGSQVANMQVVYVPLTDNSGSPYATFGFTVNDGMFTSPPAQVTLDVTMYIGITWAMSGSAGTTAPVTWALGTVAAGAILATNGNPALSAQNSGNVKELFTVTCGGSSPGGWSLASAAGNESFAMGVSTTNGPSYASLYGGNVGIGGAVTPGSALPFYLQFTAPMSTVHTAAPQTIAVTITAKAQ